MPGMLIAEGVSTDIRFFDDTVHELLEIAANTLLTGDEMYRFSFFS